MNPSTTEQPEPSRAEMECWSLLTAIAGGCSRADLAERLGLPPTLLGALRMAVDDLRRTGFVDELHDRLSVTASGEIWCVQFAARSNRG